MIERFRGASIPLADLMDAYDAGDAALAGDVSVGDDALMRDVRARLGLDDTTAGLELLGDAIGRMLPEAAAGDRTRWHDTKVQLLSSRDPARKRIAIRHLSAADYEDDAVLAAALESMLRDDDDIAREMTLSIGWNVDPIQRPHVVELLLDTLADTTRDRSPRAAFVMSAIFGLHEPPDRIPPDPVLRRIGQIIASTEDSAAFAAASDLASIAVTRGSTTVLEEWLRGTEPHLIVLAVSALNSADVTLPSSLAAALRNASDTLRAAPALPPQVVTWTHSKIDELLG